MKKTTTDATEKYFDVAKLPLIGNINIATKNETYYRDVVATCADMQVATMCLSKFEFIPTESHDSDQFITVVKGKGILSVDDNPFSLYEGLSVLIPKHSKHRIVNVSDEDLKLFTIYSRPEHKKNTKQKRLPRKLKGLIKVERNTKKKNVIV